MGGAVGGLVAVTAGVLRGVREDGVWIFRGVPYAASPGGRSRWRRPVPPEPWHGVREASSWGPIAPQPPPAPALSIPGDPQHSDEDCLNLNIWTPGLDDRGRPVLVWVHGGGFTSGCGASAICQGDRLARRGDVVVVTVNYRLGALGFLADPALGEQSGRGGGGGCGNWGLWDQVAALEWVRDHVGAFGGDPGNVTLFGESAGAMSIAVLLASPAAGRLFQRAVLESGPPVTSSVAWASRRARRLAELAGMGSAEEHLDTEQLAVADPETLVRATQALAAEAPAEGGIPLPLLPVVDGGLVSRRPADHVADGAGARVPLLVGTTRDEAALFTATDPTTRGFDADRLMRRIARFAGPSAARYLIDTYREARRAREEPADALDLLTAITTDYVFRLPSLAFAGASYKHQPATFAYLFTWESPFLGGIFGSSHGLEMPFVFGTVDDPAIALFAGAGPQVASLSERMQRAWLAFARNGDPSCEAVGDWPPYDPLRRPTMVLGPDGAVVEDPRRPERLAWDEVGMDIGGGHHQE